jgi:hypothetical protein
MMWGGRRRPQAPVFSPQRDSQIAHKIQPQSKRREKSTFIARPIAE